MQAYQMHLDLDDEVVQYCTYERNILVCERCGLKNEVTQISMVGFKVKCNCGGDWIIRESVYKMRSHWEQHLYKQEQKRKKEAETKRFIGGPLDF